MGITDRLQHAWNAFMNKDPTPYYNNSITSGGYAGGAPYHERLRTIEGRTTESCELLRWWLRSA